MGALDDRPQVQIDDRESWRAWLAEHHAASSGVWVISRKAATPGPKLEYEAAVEEALCFGWVDGQAAPVDAERSRLYFAPRRPGSPWAMSNKARVERLLGRRPHCAGGPRGDRARQGRRQLDGVRRTRPARGAPGAARSPRRSGSTRRSRELGRVLGVCPASGPRVDRARETRRDSSGANRARRGRRATQRANSERRVPLMRRLAGALSLALLLLALVAAPASAVDWDGERKLSSTESAEQRVAPNRAEQRPDGLAARHQGPRPSNGRRWPDLAPRTDARDVSRAGLRGGIGGHPRRPRLRAGHYLRVDRRSRTAHHVPA